MITLFLPVKILELSDELVKEGIIMNKSEGYRIAITEYMLRMKQFMDSMAAKPMNASK